MRIGRASARGALAVTSAVALAGGLVVATPVGATTEPSMPAFATQAVPTNLTLLAGATDRLLVTTVASKSLRSTRQAAVRATDGLISASAAGAAPVELQPGVIGIVDQTPSTQTAIVSLGRDLPADQLDQVVDAILAQPGVVAVQPDQRIYPSAVSLPDDAYFSQLWGLWNTDASSGGNADGGTSVRAPAIWETSTGSGAVVGVLDTGIVNHPDLNAQVVPGYDFISSAADARDGNRYDPDPADEGDWSDGSLCRASSSTWHGSHVAGTIGAVTDNTIGIAGVAPDVSIMPVRVLGECGGYASDIQRAILWAAGIRSMGCHC